MIYFLFALYTCVNTQHTFRCIYKRAALENIWRRKHFIPCDSCRVTDTHKKYSDRATPRRSVHTHYWAVIKKFCDTEWDNRQIMYHELLRIGEEGVLTYLIHSFIHSFIHLFIMTLIYKTMTRNGWNWKKQTFNWHCPVKSFQLYRWITGKCWFAIT
jgi:hypothetical protein